METRKPLTKPGQHGTLTRTLAQAYLDAREVDAVSGNLTASRRVTRTGLALGAALGTPTTVPPAAHAAAILAALDAAEAQGYARAMGEVVEWCKTEARDEWRTWPRGPEYKSALADVARWAAAEAWQAVRKLAERD